MIKYIFYLLVCVSSTLHAQNSEDLFQEANSLYKAGSYKEAIKRYEDIVATGSVSSELFYNLGNCYYKLNSVAPSIYNYEKALKLDPLNEDAKNNLIFAKRLALDRIEELPKSVFQKFNDRFLTIFTYNGWAIFSIVFSFITAILFLVYYFSKSPLKKRFFFTTSLISLILLLLSIIISFQQYNSSLKTVEAIVFAEEVSVKNEPTKRADEAFVLHEGTKVFVLDKVDNWNKIRLIDGKIGWLYTNEIQLLNDF